MKNLKYNFFVATKNDSLNGTLFEKHLPLIHDCNLSYKANNIEGLSYYYNKVIKEGSWTENDRIIFCHDDLLIEDYFWKDKLQEVDELYDVIGLAGGGGKVIKHNLAMWHTMTEDRGGVVYHSKDDKVFPSYFGSNTTNIKFIDGIFIMVKPLILLEKNIEFDEDFTFNHYDSSFCMSCFNKLKIGLPKRSIHVLHGSVGEYKPAFWPSNEKFKNKYYGK